MLKSVVKGLAHTAVDAYELGNEFGLRVMRRTGFLRWYLRGTLRVTNTASRWIDRFHDHEMGDLFSPKFIEEIVEFSLTTSEGYYEDMAAYFHAAIEQETLEPTGLKPMRYAMDAVKNAPWMQKEPEGAAS